MNDWLTVRSWTRRLGLVKETVNDDDAQNAVVQRLHFTCNGAVRSD